MKSKTSDTLKSKIDRFPKGYVFTYVDFIEEVDSKQAIIKALNRMVQFGNITKLSKGKYYKPQKTPFGDLEPDQYQIVKDLLEDENGNVIGYLTGLSVYNKLGLSTQVSSIIQVAKNDIRPKINRGRYVISFVRQKNIITKANVNLLQLLDCIKFIKKIPDTTFEKSYEQIRGILNEYDEKVINKLIRLSKKYPPSTRALLGSLLDSNGCDSAITETLLFSLNPITLYKFPSNNTIYKPSKWNIDEST